jgi:hypothetical protein
MCDPGGIVPTRELPANQDEGSLGMTRERGRGRAVWTWIRWRGRF